MPIYEFECPVHGVQEKFFPYVDITTDFIPCEQSLQIENGRYIPCEEIAVRLHYSLVSMQPDKYWAGHIIHGRYVTSKKDISHDIEPVTRDKLELIQKRKTQRVKETQEKQDKALKEYLTNQLSDVTIEPDGNSVKERTEYERSRGREYTGTTE